MKLNKKVVVVTGAARVIASLFFVLFVPRAAFAFCHEIELVNPVPRTYVRGIGGPPPWSNGPRFHKGGVQTLHPVRMWSGFELRSYGVNARAPRLMRVAERPRTMTIQWLGHAAFLLTSSKGTKVLMDPHGRFFLSQPVFPHVVTTSHPHRNHSFVWMASGNPIVLEGVDQGTGDWNRIHRTIRDVSIHTVPTYHDSERGLDRGNNAVFVVSMDGICTAHLGDLGHLLDEGQLKMMGKIDVLLVPLGQGGSRITSEDAAKIVQLVKPKVVIPHHYRWKGYGEDFARIFLRVRRLEGNVIKLSQDNLHSGVEIILLKDPMGAWED